MHRNGQQAVLAGINHRRVPALVVLELLSDRQLQRLRWYSGSELAYVLVGASLSCEACCWDFQMLTSLEELPPLDGDVAARLAEEGGEPMTEAIKLAAATWKPEDGVPMMDYSSQALGERKGKHTDAIVEELFRNFLLQLNGQDIDMMLEIKNKEVSALKAVAIAQEMGLLHVAAV